MLLLSWERKGDMNGSRRVLKGPMANLWKKLTGDLRDHQSLEKGGQALWSPFLEAYYCPEGGKI